METKKLNFSKVAAIIIMLCVIGILYINYFVKETADAPLMSIILLGLAIVFFFQKPAKEPEKLNLSTKKGKIILTTVIFTLVAGIATLVFTIL